MQATRDVLVLTGAFEASLREALPRKLRLVDRAEHSDVPIMLRDTHDQDLRDAGQILVQFDNDWVLIGSDGLMIEGPFAASGFVADLPAGPLRDGLSSVPDLRALLPLASGTGARQSLALLDDEDKTLARLFLLCLSGPGGSVTLASLQGLRGYDKALAQLRKALLPAATRPDQLAEKVFAALAPDLPRYVAKPDIPMARDDNAFDAASRINVAFIDVARLNEDGVMADLDTEFLHDYRVALRKVRSVLSLFKGVYSDPQTIMLKEAFSEHMAHTGRLRDLDVYLLDRQTYFDLVPNSLHPGLDVMFAAFEAERKTCLKAIAKRFKSKAYDKNISDLREMFVTPTALQAGPNGALDCETYAKQLIWKRYRKVCKIARAIDEQTPDDDVHELRIHCKKLRYLMEFFTPMFDKAEVKIMIKALKKLQDVLGLFNDYSVQQDSLRDFLEARAAVAPRSAKSRAQEMAVAQSVGALIAILHRRQLEQRALVEARFAEFDSKGTRARFVAQFQAGEARI